MTTGSATDTSSLEEHMGSCPRCRQRLAGEAALRRLRRSDPGGGASTAVRYAALASPLGTLWVAASGTGVVAAEYAVDELAFCLNLERRGHGEPVYDERFLREPLRQLDEFFAGRRTEFQLQVELSGLSRFQRTVLEVVSRIPYGSVRSYGEVAAVAGYPRAARAVGGALGINPISIIIPCHRVIRSDGTSGEYGQYALGACGALYKRMLLAREGMVFSAQS